jgi:thiosulfate/3-mercaptopyruvate sulfurtransferase
LYTHLVDCATLALHLHDPEWVVVDCRFVLSDPGAGRRAYDAGHLPGARYAHLNNDLSAPVTATSGRHPLPDAEGLAQRLGLWGIDNQKQVVAYDDSFGSMAARLWWLMRWLGHDAVALLDGSLARWQREGHPMTQELPRITPAHFVPHPRHDLWVDSATVEQVMGRGDGLVIDARAEERFNGEVELIDRVAGHIPGAVNVPFEDNLHLSGRFLDPPELRELYKNILAGVPAEKTILMCGSGVTACHSILALERAGMPGARLYAGSWSEWITDPRRPVASDA